MHLTVREEERIQIWAAAEMARRRLERGVKLNGSVAKSGYLVTCLRDLPRGVEA